MDSGVLVRRISYQPLPAQRRFHESDARFKIFTGPVGSGKTAALVQECIRLSVINAGLPGILGSPTYRMLEDVTKRELLRVLEENNIPHEHRKSDNVVFLTDVGTPIFCRSLEDPTRLVGANTAWFGIDEQTYTKEASFLRLQARLRHPKATQLCGFGACTPNGFDWTYDRFIGEKKTPDYEAVRASPRENFHLPPDYYDQLARSYDPRFFRQEVLGEFLALQGGTVYHAFDRNRDVVTGLQYRRNAKFFLSCDYNIGNMSWVYGNIVDFAPNIYTSSPATKRIEFLSEILIRDSTIDLACSAFVDRTKHLIHTGQRLTVHVYGDASGQNRMRSGDTDHALTKAFFSRHPEYELVWHIERSNPAVRDRVNAVNAALYNASGQDRVKIDPSCKALIKDLERVAWAQDSFGNTLDGMNKKDPQLGHMVDAAGYVIYQEFPLNRGNVGYQTKRLI